MLNRQIESEFQSFKEGFSLVCTNSSIGMFRPEELELLVCGEPNLDFAELERHTVYDGYSKDSQTIK